MTAPDLLPILERIGNGGLVLIETSEGVQVTWDRVYPCGEVRHGNELVRRTRAEALAAVVDLEDEQDARDSQDDPRDRCLICFPVREGEDRQGLFEVELPEALASLLSGNATDALPPEPAAPMVAVAELVKDYDRPRVINRHHYPGGSSTFPQPWAYIGRPSALGNPYLRRDHGAGALTLYREWLWGKVQERDPEVLAALNAISPRHHLVCSCAPRPCHGDVVVEAWEWLTGKGHLLEGD